MIDEINKALSVLRNGGIILYPTDTIWGIGCDATNAEAVNRVYSLKQREETKSMLVLVEHADRIGRYVKEIPEVALELIEVNDKPMTIIYPGAINLAQNLVGKDKTIGIRIVQDDFCQKLIAKLNRPIVSTSANISGQPSPAIFSEISDEIKNGVDYVVNWRQNDATKSLPSSIIKVGIGGEIEIIRK
ncbi:MAG TPA: L-threonylcarbamoyladenylate synthase [Bacteroidales bacterium]